MRLNPYKIGIVFYSVLVISVFFLIGCDTLVKYQQREIMKKEAENILNTPNIKKNH